MVSKYSFTRKPLGSGGLNDLHILIAHRALWTDCPIGERLFEASGELQDGVDVRAVQVSSAVLNDRKGPNIRGAAIQAFLPS